jgi:hypothetical protein
MQVAGVNREAVWRMIYPEMELSGVDRLPPRDGRTFDVLLLGGSVLHPCFGDVAERLAARLQERLGRPVRVANLAGCGRTSADSRSKYEHLGPRHFDLVVFYHGINDVFINNCPPGAFESDYGHVCHIAQARALDRHPELSWFCLPYTLEYASLNIRDRWRLSGSPRHDWMIYGNDLRTPPSFEANLQAVADRAAARGEPLLLMTFAYHIPPDYTEEAFAAKALDYDRHLAPVSMWGEVDNVRRGLEAHNEAVRRVAARSDALFVDMAGRLPHGRLCFDDPCHLNAEGRRCFVEIVVERLEAARLGAAASGALPARGL